MPTVHCSVRSRALDADLRELARNVSQSVYVGRATALDGIGLIEAVLASHIADEDERTRPIQARSPRPSRPPDRPSHDDDRHA